jgi:hypothetical protein
VDGLRTSLTNYLPLPQHDKIYGRQHRVGRHVTVQVQDGGRNVMCDKTLNLNQGGRKTWTDRIHTVGVRMSQGAHCHRRRSDG